MYEQEGGCLDGCTYMKGEAEKNSPVFTSMRSPRVAGRDGQRTNRTNSRSEETGDRSSSHRPVYVCLGHRVWCWPRWAVLINCLSPMWSLSTCHHCPPSLAEGSGFRYNVFCLESSSFRDSSRRESNAGGACACRQHKQGLPASTFPACLHACPA